MSNKALILVHEMINDGFKNAFYQFSQLIDC